MRSFDFAPFYRSSIGFDRMFDLLENTARLQAPDWPPYDIVKTGDNVYRISMAVAGFAQDEIQITAQPNMLVVKGEKRLDSEGEYLHQGITAGAFSRQFELADYVKVTAASLENGVLTIDLEREVPEAMKPRRIEIRGDGQPRQIGQKKAA